MAQVLERINELQALPTDQHWFCPRVGLEGGAYFEEDTAYQPPLTDAKEIRERDEKVHQARERKWVALDALQVLAFDGEEAEPFQAWMLDRLDWMMSTCDVCVRVFHQSRADWRAHLIEQYDEDNIAEFLRTIDGNCIKRITKGLGEARSALLSVDPNKRTVRVLPETAMYAVFEALSCDAFIRNEELLQQHFDEPFQLVQTRKRLKLPVFLPAMARFLFSAKQFRRDWAVDSWSSFKRDVLPSEFEWAVRDHVVDAMWRVQMTNLDLPFTTHFWFGMRLIITKCGKEIVRDSIRGLEGNLYKLLLDHLSLRSEGFLDLIATITLLLEKSPADFWDAMDAITPSTATVVEQVLNGPVLKQILQDASEDNPPKCMEDLEHAFVWIAPFLGSIKPANLTPACKAFTNLLFSRLQTSSFPSEARERCIQEGLFALDYSFKKMNEGKNLSNFVGQPTVNGMLDILSTHINLIVSCLKGLNDGQSKGNSQIALSMIQQAFTLESQSLAVERQLITAKKPSPTETPPSRPIWKAVLAVIDVERVELAVHLLVAGRNLIGLEPLLMKPSVQSIPPTVRHFNDRFKLLSQSVTDVMDRLGEFDPTKLSPLFEHPAAASSIISTLFSSTEETRLSSVELLKVISGQDARRDALQHILRTYYKNSLQGIADSCRQVMRKKAFSPAPSLVKTCSDIIDVMCNSQDGILRSRSLNSDEAAVTLLLWKNLWDTLTVIFKTTEDWSILGAYDKSMMMNFCRDTMAFADQLFDECSIFSTALDTALNNSKAQDGSSRLKDLLDSPARSMEGLSRWLRLRDEFLSSKSVTLISKLLVRLKRVSIEVDSESLLYIERVLLGEVKAKLNMTQEAELQRALEIHLGRPMVKQEPETQPRQLSVDKWIGAGRADSLSKQKEVDNRQIMNEATRAANQFAQRRETLRIMEARTAKQKEEAKAAQAADFKKKRQAELERQKQEKAAAIARLKQQRAGFSEVTAEAGSGLEGLGVLGKDQAPKGEGLMHSSDESSSDDDDIDEEIFGIKKPKKEVGPKTNIVDGVKVPMPVKKRRVIRSKQDMRARLAPDLSPLHKVILSWNYFHDGDFPPNSRPDIYSRVPNVFRTPNDYQATFEPLLTLEAWQGFVRSREENPLRPYEIKVVSRAAVDAFQEVSSTLGYKENKDLGISEGDVVLLSQSKMPNAEDRHCLARVFRVQHKPSHMEVSYRIMPSNSLLPALAPNSTVYGSKVQSITPLEREYGALLGLQYYDLCDEICKAKPSPILKYKDSQLDPLIETYNVNKAQAKAIKSAMDNDAFTLIQGPPGSGKTKTITAIVGAILSSSSQQVVQGNTASKKLLVCAPSNAAVDELVMRFKQGIKTLKGQQRNVNVVRIGRSDAINANVQDVTLERLVNKRLGVNNGNGNGSKEDTQKIFDEHKKISAQVRELQDQLNSGMVKGPDASKMQNDLNILRKQKASLGTKIDNVKDEEKVASRTAELNRRRAQEAILGEAHVICATLSGSGHDMFQGLSIEFETVIVDEAAQCVEMSALIPLKYGCAKCILVGDPKQLPPTVFSKEAARFQYEQSLFVRMQANHPDDVHLLDTQYRMHPDISLFPSQTFYDGRLLDGPNMAGLRKRPWHDSSILAPYRFFDVQGQHQSAPKGHSLINLAEIAVAKMLYKRLVSDYADIDFRGKIGIITPYKSQLRELKLAFAKDYGDGIIDDVEFNTTDAFQGRESEVIIFSCVRASPAGGIGFLQDIRRMNVGLTRAKSSLWVLGNSQSLMRGEFWRKLVEDARRREQYTEGNLFNMLNKHSSKFPAKKNKNAMPRVEESSFKPPSTSWIPVKRDDSELMDFMFDKPQPKPEIKQESVKQEEEPAPQGVKRKASTEDVDMLSPSESPATPDTGEDGTPGAASDTGVQPAPGEIKTEAGEAKAPSTGPPATAPPPGDIIGGMAMAKPKIRRKRPDANPLLVRKKPRPG